MKNKLNIEQIENNGIRYAEIIWGNTEVETTTFFSPSESSFQFGLLAHKAGFKEPAHFHKPIARTISDLQQMFVVQKGIVEVLLYTDAGDLLRRVILKANDSIVLIHGAHAINVLEDMQCISVKQGPYLGKENDKVFVEVKK